MDVLRGVIARTGPRPITVVRAGLVGLVVARLLGAGRRRRATTEPGLVHGSVDRGTDGEGTPGQSIPGQGIPGERIDDAASGLRLPDPGPEVSSSGRSSSGRSPSGRSPATATDQSTPSANASTPVTIVVPARDEAHRIGPLLTSLRDVDAEVLVVDDDSSDRTAEVAARAGATVVPAGPLPAGWAGKAHALDVGIRAARTPLVVTLDADTEVTSSFAAWMRTLVRVGTGPVLVTAGARVQADSAGERWLHPAMLTTLVYRFGPPGIVPANPNRSMANGQCMVLDRARFLDAGGMGLVADRLVEDVALARTLRLGGHDVGFVDGSAHVSVAGYGSAAAAWRGWGRSLDLAEVSPVPDQLLDLAVLWAALALPLPRLAAGRGDLVDVLAVALRLGTLAGTASAYARRGVAYWASPLADIPVAARVSFGTLRRDRRWKGRDYADVAASDR